MATTINSQVSLGVTTSESLDTATVAPGAASPIVSHAAYKFSKKLNAASTPVASIISEKLIAAGASGSIDLTALNTTEGVRSASGKKLVFLQLTNLSAAHDFTLIEGASNGYAIKANAIVVPPGGSVALYFAAALGAVGGSDKTLDWTFNAGASGGVQSTLILG